MSPLAQAIIVVCIAVLSAALVATLMAVRKTTMRADSVLHQVEREIRPMMGQMELLAGELRELSKNANDELRRIGVFVRRAEDVSVKVSTLLGAVSGITRVGQYASLAMGVKKGVDVFVQRLRTKR